MPGLLPQVLIMTRPQPLRSMSLGLGVRSGVRVNSGAGGGNGGDGSTTGFGMIDQGRVIASGSVTTVGQTEGEGSREPPLAAGRVRAQPMLLLFGG